MTHGNDGTEPRLIGEDGKEHTLEGTQLVGRSDSCDITVESPRVSRQHATLTTADGRVTVEDGGSANGTFVNDQRIQSLTTLRHGDRLCFEKHCFTVQGARDSGDDATIIAPQAPGSDATVISTAANLTTATGKQAQDQVAGPAADLNAGKAALDALPGSWVDDGTGDKTRILGPGEAPASVQQERELVRALDSAHFLLDAGAAGSVRALELTPGESGDEDVWEIGRDSSCEIAIDDTAVSERHAQLVHRDGRWRIVNLVSTNGLFVNDERRIKAYLDDGDTIRLGTSTLVFYAAKSGARPAKADRARADAASNTGTSVLWKVAGAVIVLGVLAWLILS